MTREHRARRAIHRYAVRAALGLLASAIVVLVSLTTAGAAAAHAMLISTTPGNGASLDQAPEQLVLRFDEPVETVSETVRVFDATGRPIAVGSIEQIGERVIVAKLNDGLPNGTYAVAWRFVSADSHPLRGAFVFSVGEPLGSVSSVVLAALASESDSRELDAVQAIARFAALALVLLCLGGPALLLSGGHGPHVVRSAWRVVLGSALGLGLATLTWMTATGAEALGLGLDGLLRLQSIREVVGTSFGQVWAARIGLALALAWIAAFALQRRFGTRTGALAALAFGAGLALTFPLSGHARVEGVVGVASDATHTAAAGMWVGGLAVLCLALVTAGTERGSLLQHSVPPFSALALGSVAMLLATGIGNALIELPELAALWETTYGRLVLAKGALLAVLVGAGALHRRVTLPKLRRAEGAGSRRLFLRLVGVELALMAVVVGVTAALVAEPPRAAATGSVSNESTIGRLDPALRDRSPDAFDFTAP